MASRRDRLHQLLDLARAYRGWSRAQLARALNRDTTRLYSETEDPKFSFVVALADVLEWPMDGITEYLWTGSNPYLEAPPPEPAQQTWAGLDFKTLYPQAQQAYKQGRYAEAIAMSKQLLTVAESANDRARAFNVEFSGWDGLGRYTKAAEAIKRALMETPIDTGLRVGLQGQLAMAHYTLWELPAAMGIAAGCIEWFEDNKPTELGLKAIEAYSYYVRGNSRRRSAVLEPERLVEHAQKGLTDLRHGRALFLALAEEFDAKHLANTAHTCEGAILEVEVELGLRPALKTIEMMVEHLDPATDPQAVSDGSWLESYGWWCVFGGNLALRHLNGPELQRPLAIFINKALEIGEATNNWTFRERVLTMEHQLRKKLSDATGYLIEPTIDTEDIRLITGTMGRFPNFHRLGWEILTTAKVIHHGRRN